MIRGLSPLARAVLVLAGVLTLAIAGQHRNLARSVQDLGVEPTGYREIVNRALRDKLSYERIEDLDASDETGRLIIETLPERLTEADRQFLASSFLLEDLEHPERFEPRSDGTARLLPGFRRRPLPFSETAVWRGRLAFAESAEAPVLVSRSGRVLQLKTVGEALPTATAVPLRAPTEGEETVLAGPHFSWQTGGEVAFRIYAVPAADGGVSVVLSRPRGAVGSLQQNGTHTAAAGALRALAPGDWLVYRHGGVSDVFHLQAGRSGVVSDYRRGRHGWERTFEDAWGLEDLARGTAGSLDRLISWLSEANARNTSRRQVHRGGGPVAEQRDTLRDRDLVLTLDPVVQAAAQGLLDEQLGGRMPPGGWSLEGVPRLPPRAALVVTDLDSAALLAAASYPDADALDAHLEALRGGSADRALVDWVTLQAGRRRHALVRNHAFDDHQVGSTVKPLFAAAVALADTPLDPLTLEVRASGDSVLTEAGEVPSLKGAREDWPVALYKDHCQGVIDFQEYLARSCHAFQFRLGALALESTDGVSPALCDGGLGSRLEQGRASTPATPAEAQGLSPLATYAWLTGAVLRDPETTGVHRWNTAWWAPLDREIETAVERDLGCGLDFARSLGPVSPLRVNLDVGSLDRCTPHYSSFLKGGATNRWSNADLSVAYTRLVTGRALTGHLLVEGAPASGAFSPSDCGQSVACGDPDRYERVRREVLAGMTRALSDGSGTARRLRSPVEQTLADLEEATGARWGAYAKTGSSVRPATLVTRVDDALEPVRERETEVPVANFVLALVRCEEGLDSRRQHPLGCNRLPPLGEPVEGMVVHLWIDGVSDLDSGAEAAGLLGTDPGRTLLDRVSHGVGP